MSRLKPFFEGIALGKTRVFVSVVITTILIPFLVNVLFLSEHFKSVMADRLTFVLIALVIYIGWLVLLWLLFTKDTLCLTDLSLTFDKLKVGAIAGLIIYLGANLITLTLIFVSDQNVVLAEQFSSVPLILEALSLFTFNILIGAFIEEVVMRAYLIPQVFLRIRRKINHTTISLVITVLFTQAFFAASHIPRDLFRLDFDLHQTMSNTIVLFVSGLFFTAIFLFTKNVFFVTIVHAFFNMSLPIFSTSSFTLNVEIVAIVVVLFGRRLFVSRDAGEGVLRGGLS